MAKSYNQLLERVKPEVREKAEEKTKKLLLEMHLNELRKARKKSQVVIGKKLNIKQAAISRIESRTDMYISTLRDYIKALGGELEIVARFQDMDVKIDQFKELAAEK